MEGGSASASTAAPASGESASTGEPAEGSEIQTQATPVAQDDPEIELEDGVRLKRSELRDLHKRRKELDKGAFDKFQEAAKLRKEADAARAEAKSLVDSLGSDAKAALRKAGIDPIKLAEQILTEALDDHKLSPAERRVKELEAEKAQREKADEETKKANEEKQAAEHVAQWEQRFDQAFTGAIQTVGLPKTARVVARMAEKVESYWGAGVQVPLEEIAAEIKQDIIQERRELLQSMKDEERASLFDDSEFEIVRKAALRKAQGGINQPKIAQPAPAKKKPGGLTMAEFQARIDKRMGLK